MNPLRWCCPRVPVLHSQIGLRPGNDPAALPMGSTAMRKVVGRIPLARDEARSLSRAAPASTWTRVSRAGAARSFTGLSGAAGPWVGRLPAEDVRFSGSLLSTRCREGGALRVFGVRRVRAVRELASPARLDEWTARLLGH